MQQSLICFHFSCKQPFSSSTPYPYNTCRTEIKNGKNLIPVQWAILLVKGKRKHSDALQLMTTNMNLTLKG